MSLLPPIATALHGMRGGLRPTRVGTRALGPIRDDVDCHKELLEALRRPRVTVGSRVPKCVSLRACECVCACVCMRARAEARELLVVVVQVRDAVQQDR